MDAVMKFLWATITGVVIATANRCHSRVCPIRSRPNQRNAGPRRGGGGGRVAVNSWSKIARNANADPWLTDAFVCRIAVCLTRKNDARLYGKHRLQESGYCYRTVPMACLTAKGILHGESGRRWS